MSGRGGPLPFTAALLSLVLLASGGCASSHPPVRSWMAEIDRSTRDIQRLPASSPSTEILAAAREKRDRADQLLKKGKEKDAAAVAELALADTRAALEAALASHASSDADACLQAAEKARRRWDEALRFLVETEQIARKTAPGVPHDLSPADLSVPDFPPTTLRGSTLSTDEAALRDVEAAWSRTADKAGVPAGDLTSRFQAALERTDRAKGKDRETALYLASRTVQELEARVRTAVFVQTCSRAAAVAGDYGDAADRAREASLYLERGLRDDLRGELERTRTEAESRQTQLFDALQQLQGKYARISRDARGTIVSLADILFDFDKATLKRNVEFSLVRVATILNQFPEMKIAVEGHTDNVGSPDYNLELSQRRAQAVYEFLVSQEVAPERMTVAGYGMTRPVADNGTEEGRQKNRRVDLVIQEGTGTPAPGIPGGGAPDEKPSGTPEGNRGGAPESNPGGTPGGGPQR